MKRWVILILFSSFGSPSYGFNRSLGPGAVPLSWNQRCIPFAINRAGSDDLSIDQVTKTVTDSFQTWEDVTCSSQEFPYLGLTDVSVVGYNQNGPNINVVVFRERPEEWTGPAHSRVVIALTSVIFCKAVSGRCTYIGQILDADIELNGAFFSFSVDDSPPVGRFDLGNTITHEVGHLVGLEHNCSEDRMLSSVLGECNSEDRQGTMYEEAPPQEIKKRSLEDDDRLGICAIYPVVDDAVPCEESLGPGIILGDGGVFVEPTAVNDTIGCEGCRTTGGPPGPGSTLLLALIFALFPGRRRGR